MLIGWIATLVFDVIAFMHYVPSDALVSFVDGDDADLPILLD
jgi:hypothetical protein